MKFSRILVGAVVGDESCNVDTDIRYQYDSWMALPIPGKAEELMQFVLILVLFYMSMKRLAVFRKVLGMAREAMESSKALD